MEEVNTGELKTFPIPVATNLSNHTAEIKGQELMVLFVPYTAPVVLFDVHFKDNGDNKWPFNPNALVQFEKVTKFW